MGLSASQARFLQLTARRSNIEYQAQQINFERLQLATQMEQASSKYQDATSNTHMVFSFNNGTGTSEVDVSYSNYINYMNQQGTTTSHDKLYLLSTSGKIVVQSEEDMQAMIERHTEKVLTQEEYYQEQLKNFIDDAGNDVYTPVTLTASDGSTYTQYEKRILTEEDFVIVDDLNDVDMFQEAIQDGTYTFARMTFENDAEGNKIRTFKTESWDTICAGAISEKYDKTDDAQAQAEYDAVNSRLQKIDKMLELELDQLESEREAIQTEIESVEKVIDDNIEKSFNTFS